MPQRLQRDNAYAWILATSPLPTGLVIALFSDRFTSRSWRFAGAVPGGYTLWSGVLLACGALMLAALLVNKYRSPRQDRLAGLLITGMWICGLWWFIMGGSFFATAIIDPLANPLGAVVWWIVCAFYWTWVWYESRRL